MNRRSFFGMLAAVPLAIFGARKITNYPWPGCNGTPPSGDYGDLLSPTMREIVRMETQQGIPPLFQHKEYGVTVRIPAKIARKLRRDSERMERELYRSILSNGFSRGRM